MNNVSKIVLGASALSWVPLMVLAGCGGSDGPGTEPTREDMAGSAGAETGGFAGGVQSESPEAGVGAGAGAGGATADDHGRVDGMAGQAGNGEGGAPSQPASPCAAPCEAANATAECVDSACVITACSDDYVDCNERPRDGCEARETGLPGEPRLLAPALGAHTGSVHAEDSLRPHFRWAAARTGSCDAVFYELEIDDSCEPGNLASCDFPSPEVHETGIDQLEWVPALPLPVSTLAPMGSRYFWRVRACETTQRCSGWSPVRYVDVGRLRDDLNGDGYSDLFALSVDTESHFRTYFVPGGAELPSVPGPVLPSSSDWYADARWVGDVNGDGYSDVLRVFSFEPPTLFLGGPDLLTLRSVTLPSSGAPASWSGAGAGDWNGDGYADLIASEYSPSIPAQGEALGVLHLYLGNSSLKFDAPFEVRAPAGTTAVEFGVAVEGNSDINGDGLPDAFVLDGDEGRIHAVYGSSTGMARINASFTTGGPCHYYTRAALLAAGDLNGDGFGDLAALCRPNALVYLGARAPALLPHWSSVLEPGDVTIAGGRDLGADGYPDLLFGAGNGAGTGLVLLPGSAEFSNVTEVIPFGGSLGDAGERGGYGVTVGDHDGDGRWDIAVQVSNASRVRWFGGSAGIAATPTSCSQPESSFSLAGSWCAAPVRDIAGIIAQVGPDGDSAEYRIGPSFGHVLAR